MIIHERLMFASAIRSVAPVVLLATTAFVPYGAPVLAQSPGLTTITTDTGALAPGHRDFSRYDTPGMCLAALAETRAIAQGSLKAQAFADTTRDVGRDTTGIGRAALVARACLSRFDSAKVVPSDLPQLFSIALILRDDTLALRALSKRISRAVTAEEASAIRLSALVSLLGLEYIVYPSSLDGLSRPPLLAAAHRVMGDLAKDPSFAKRAQMHDILLRFCETQDSLDAVTRAARDLLAVLHAAPRGAIASDSVWIYSTRAYRALLDVAFLTDPNAVTAIAEQVKRDSLEIWDEQRQQNRRADQITTGHVIDLLSVLGTDRDPAKRRAVPPLQAAFLFPNGRDTTAPVPGKVTVFITGGGAQIADRVRQWLARYEKDGLVVTVVEATDDTAAYWAKERYGVIRGPLTPAAAAEQIRWYYQDYEQLPVTVAVQLHKIRFTAWPDGRRMRTGKSQFEDWMHLSNLVPRLAPGSMLVVGRDGKELLSWNGLNRISATITMDRFLAWALAQPYVPKTAGILSPSAMPRL